MNINLTEIVIDWLLNLMHQSFVTAAPMGQGNSVLFFSFLYAKRGYMPVLHEHFYVS